MATNTSGKFEMELSQPGRPALPLTANLVFKECLFHETAFGPSSATISLTAGSTSYVDQHLRAAHAQGTPLLRFRLGYGTSGSTLWIPWQTHLIGQYKATQQGAGAQTGHAVQLVTADPIALLGRIPKVRGWRGEVSRIVRTIADEYGFTDAVIEDTQDAGNWVQSFLTDAVFIRQRLMPMARNAAGIGNYVFFAKDSTLHFHSWDYQAAMHQANYEALPSGSLVFSDLGQTKLLFGAGGSRLITHDPYSGSSQVFESVPDKALRLANTLANLPKVGSAHNARLHLGSNRLGEATNRAQNAYEAARAESYTITMDLAASAPLRAGDFIDLNISPLTGASPWSGLYFVASATHRVNGGELASVYALTRGETTTAQSPQSVGIAAPGHPINTQKVQTSKLVSGQGGAGYPSTLVTIKEGA